ncbi:MAG: SNF2-related protein, partial [Planctomycetota bacterium]|nr:SNF2-related protein [Planctomycetota bacterium]
MPRLDVYNIPTDLVLGVQKNDRVPHADQDRQRAEIEQILIRLRDRPGVILADEVGMGKTFVALGVAYSIAAQSRRGPVIVMVPANLVDKWVQDLKTFCELYAENRKPVLRDEVSPSEFRSRRALRYGVARHSVDLMKLLDDDTRERCHIVFLAQGAMGRKQTDKWIRLALIREALRRHGRGGAKRLIQVKKRIHRFLAGLLWAIGEQRASDWGDVLWQRLLGSDPTKWKEIYNESLRNDRNRLRDDPVPQSVIDVLRPKNRSRLRPKNRSRLDLKPLAEELAQMPLRRSAGTSKHIAAARQALIAVEVDLWKELLAATNWKSPLLVMDEAHHLKNPATSLA